MFLPRGEGWEVQGSPGPVCVLPPQKQSEGAVIALGREGGPGVKVTRKRKLRGPQDTTRRRPGSGTNWAAQRGRTVPLAPPALTRRCARTAKRAMSAAPGTAGRRHPERSAAPGIT
jgi:hypothetical protein